MAFSVADLVRRHPHRRRDLLAAVLPHLDQFVVACGLRDGFIRQAIFQHGHAAGAACTTVSRLPRIAQALAGLWRQTARHFEHAAGHCALGEEARHELRDLQLQPDQVAHLVDEGHAEHALERGGPDEVEHVVTAKAPHGLLFVLARVLARPHLVVGLVVAVSIHGDVVAAKRLQRHRAARLIAVDVGEEVAREQRRGQRHFAPLDRADVVGRLVVQQVVERVLAVRDLALGGLAQHLPVESANAAGDQAHAREHGRRFERACRRDALARIGVRLDVRLHAAARRLPDRHGVLEVGARRGGAEVSAQDVDQSHVIVLSGCS